MPLPVGYLIPFPFPLINEKRPKNSSFFPEHRFSPIAWANRGTKDTKKLKKAITRKRWPFFPLSSRINLRNFGGQLFPLIKGIFFRSRCFSFSPAVPDIIVQSFFLWKTTIAPREREEHQNGAHLHAPLRSRKGGDDNYVLRNR